MTMTITAAATRWFGNLPSLMAYPRAMEMMIVSFSSSHDRTDLQTSIHYAYAFMMVYLN